MSKRIAIITPGGDAPGVNACIRVLVRKGIAQGFEMLGVYHGYQGLINGEISRLHHNSVSGIIHRGGTILKSTRSQEITTHTGLRRAVAGLRKHAIDYLVVIGGDGSFRAGLKIAQAGIPIIGIPASIDNDVFGTDETIGFDTAINTAVEAIDKIRDTATSFDRIFLVEVMGREHGFLAQAVGLASGADFTILPEKPYNLRRICAELIKDKAGTKTSEIIVVAEGTGSIMDMARKIEVQTKVPVRVSVLGYIQRGGTPSARSRILASLFANYAIDLIRHNIRNRVIVLRKCSVQNIPLERVVHGKKKLSDLTKNLSL